MNHSFYTDYSRYIRPRTSIEHTVSQISHRGAPRAIASKAVAMISSSNTASLPQGLHFRRVQVLAILKHVMDHILLFNSTRKPRKCRLPHSSLEQQVP